MRILAALLLSTLAATPAAWAGGTLRIDSDRPGQTVLIDGEDLGLVTPAVVPALKPGPYVIRVFDDCRVGETRATVRDGRSTDLTVHTRELPATLDLAVSPPEASVTIDGEAASAGEQQVSCGSHSIRATLAGHTPIVVSLDLQGGNVVELPLTLQPIGSAELTVDVNVESAFVLLDGDLIGEGGTFERAVSAGPHQLRVEADGYEAYAEDLLLQDGELRKLDVKLRKGKGKAAATARGPAEPRPARQPRERQAPVITQTATEPAPRPERVARERAPIDLKTTAGWSMAGVGAGVGVLAAVQLYRMAGYGREYNEMVETYRTTPSGEEPTAASIEAFRQDTLLPQRNRAVGSTIAATALLAGGLSLTVEF